jgi:hypothetical protein
MARSKKRPGINGGFIFKGKTFAGTFGCKCVRIATVIITTTIADAKNTPRLNNYLDNFLLNKTLPIKRTPAQISPVIPSQYKDSLMPLLVI